MYAIQYLNAQIQNDNQTDRTHFVTKFLCIQMKMI